VRGSGGVFRISFISFLVVVFGGMLMFELEWPLRFFGASAGLFGEGREVMLIAGGGYACTLFVVLIARGVEWLGAPPWLTGTIACIVGLGLWAVPLMMPLYYGLVLCALWCVISTIVMAYAFIPARRKSLPATPPKSP